MEKLLAGPGFFDFVPGPGGGCTGGRPEPPPPPPHAGALVRVVCPNPFTRRLIAAASRGWQSRQQARVEVVDGEQAAADVWVLPAAELLRDAAAGRLEPLPDSLTADPSFNWMGLMQLYRERLLVWDRVRYAVPLIGDAPICCYRTDLLHDAGHQAAFQKKYGRPLAPPVTWQDFEQIAAFFAGLNPSLPPLPADDEALRREFYTIAACYATRAVPEEERVPGDERDRVFSFHYDLKTGQPRLATPGFVACPGTAAAAAKASAPGPPAVPEKTFAAGKAVFCLTRAWALGLFQDRHRRRGDKVAVCRMPGGECWYGTTGGPTPAGANPNDVPYQGAGAWASRGAADGPAARGGLFPAGRPGRPGHQRADRHRRPAGRTLGRRRYPAESTGRAVALDAFDLDRRQTAALKDALRHTLDRNLKNPVVCLRTPEAVPGEAEPRFLRQALQPGGDAARALQAAAASWAAAAKPDQARIEYRLSLGLLAR